MNMQMFMNEHCGVGFNRKKLTRFMPRQHKSLNLNLPKK